MNKLFFSNYDDLKNPYYAGGGATSVHEVAMRLQPDFDVTVLTGKYPGSKNDTIDGIKYERVGIGFLGAMVGQLSFYFSLPWYALIKEYDVWVESFTPPFSTACLQLFTRKPVIGLTHSLSGKDMREKYGIPFDFFEGLGLKSYHNVITLNPFVRDRILQSNPAANIIIIPNGLDQSYIDMTVGEKENYILYIGRIDIRQKGLDLLLEAYRSISKDLVVPLKIVGSGLRSEEKKLKNNIKEYHLENSITCVGKITGEEKRNILKKALFLVMPSRVENFPLVLLEAFSASMPAITFDIPGTSWTTAGVVLKAKNFDPNSFGQLMEKMLADKVLLNQMSFNAKLFVKEFTWEATTQKYKDYINKVLIK